MTELSEEFKALLLNSNQKMMDIHDVKETLTEWETKVLEKYMKPFGKEQIKQLKEELGITKDEYIKCSRALDELEILIKKRHNKTN